MSKTDLPTEVQNALATARLTEIRLHRISVANLIRDRQAAIPAEKLAAATSLCAIKDPSTWTPDDHILFMEVTGEKLPQLEARPIRATGIDEEARRRAERALDEEIPF